jgi:hypothetical protein
VAPVAGTQLPFRGMERITHGNEEILVGLFVVVVAVHGHLAARNHEFDVNAVEITFFVVAMGRFSDHTACGNRGIDGHKPIEPFANSFFGKLWRRKISERDLNIDRHVRLPCRCPFPRVSGRFWRHGLWTPSHGIERRIFNSNRGEIPH